MCLFFFFSSRRRHTRCLSDWSSDVCSSDLEGSLTAFVRRTLKLDPMGRNIRIVKDQLNRLSASDFRIYASYEGHAVTVKGTIIQALDLWVSKDERQRVLWPTTVQFSQLYFESLMEHAVPLNEGAVRAL